MKRADYFYATGATTNIGCGFVPDVLMLYMNDSTNIQQVVWFKSMYDEYINNGVSVFGYKLNGADGITTPLTSAAGGVVPYDSKANVVLVDSPVPGKGKIECSVADWLAATNYSSGARTAIACGTIVRPTVHNGFVYELTTNTSTGTSAPASWPTVPGQTCTDGGGNVWTCRKENIAIGGQKGFTLGGSSMPVNTNDKRVYYIAETVDKVQDKGDAILVGASGVI
jgi:hypothetical protein